MIKTSEYVYLANGELRRADSELYHYGVKGMKWGIRRTKKQLGNDSVKRIPLVREKTTDKALHDRINNLRNMDDFNAAIRAARNICTDISTTRKPADRDKFLSELSTVLDADISDDPSVMAVDKKSGRMRYNACGKFYANGIHENPKTGLFDPRDLDKALNENPGSMDYYVWGERQNRD